MMNWPHGDYTDFTLEEARSLVADRGFGDVVGYSVSGSFSNNLDHPDSDRDLYVVVERTNNGRPRTLAYGEDDVVAIPVEFYVNNTFGYTEGHLGPFYRVNGKNNWAPYLMQGARVNPFLWHRLNMGALNTNFSTVLKNDHDLKRALKFSGRALKDQMRLLKVADFIMSGRTDFNPRFTDEERNEYFTHLENLKNAFFEDSFNAGLELLHKYTPSY